MIDGNFNVSGLKEAGEGGNGTDAGNSSTAAGGAGAAAAEKKDTPPGGDGGAAAVKTPEQLAAEAEALKKNTGTESGATDLTAEQKEAAAKAAQTSTQGKPLTQEEIKSLATKEILEQLGVDSLDALKDKLAPKIELTDAQKLEAQNKYEANVDNFAITNNLMTKDDIVALANVLKSDAQTLAFSEFTKDFKATKADATATEIEQAFKLFYNIDSTDEALKAYGLKEIEKKAASVKSELAAKRDAAKSQFDEREGKKSKIPGFTQVLSAAIKTNVPEEITLLADGENKSVFKVTPEIKKELEKFLVTQDLFDEYASAGATPQLSDKLKDRINGFLFLKNKEAMFKTIYDAGVAAGGKNGSTTGASASFKTTGEGTNTLAVVADDKEFTQAETEKIGKVFGGRR